MTVLDFKTIGLKIKKRRQELGITQEHIANALDVNPSHISTDIVSFSKEDLLLLDEYFRGTNAETAYLLGKVCGLRINECFGLKWENVDLENGTIRIDRQMQYQEGLIKLVVPKTRNANRTIYLNDEMCAFLSQRRQQWNSADEKTKALRIQRQRMIEDIDGNLISSSP